jgi:hypothetical protein
VPRKPVPAAPKAEPWKPPHYEPADVIAFQALNRGEASPDQQKRALRYVIETLTGTYDMAYRPASPRDTDFALGKAFVGQQIVKLLNLSLSVLKDTPREQG